MFVLDKPILNQYDPDTGSGDFQKNTALAPLHFSQNSIKTKLSLQKKVLIWDLDTVDSQAEKETGVISLVLNNFGYETDVALSFQKGIEYLKANSYFAIIMDVAKYRKIFIKPVSVVDDLLRESLDSTIFINFSYIEDFSIKKEKYLKLKLVNYWSKRANLSELCERIFDTLNTESMGELRNFGDNVLGPINIPHRVKRTNDVGL